MNALTDRENKARPTSETRTHCYDETTQAWDRACTGYRLPTEVEWEYARELRLPVCSRVVPQPLIILLQSSGMRAMIGGSWPDDPRSACGLSAVLNARKLPPRRSWAIRRTVATVVYAGFEWDEGKAELNERKHGVTFEKAVTALVDPRAIEAPDYDDPDRFVTVGMSAFLRVLFVVHTEHTRTGRIRIISARKASALQRRIYEED